MTLKDILAGESENLEFKQERPADSKKYMKSIVAFANGHGGRLLIGIADNPVSVVGVSNDILFQEIDAITNAISDSCTPAIIPDITVQTIEGKSVIVVEIRQGMQRPYYLKSEGLEHGVYIRVAGTSRLAEYYQIQEMLCESTRLSYDKTACSELQISNEDIDSFCDSLSKAAQKQGNNKQVTVNQLLSWGVLTEENGKILPTKAYALLNGNNVIPTKIQCGVFKGTNRAIFVDRREFSGSLLNQVEEAYQYVLSKINMGVRINGLFREDVYEIPEDAIRELIINAVVHRSYLDHAAIQIALYDDRLEITSPGGLMRGLTIDRIKDGYSKSRNEALAAVFLYLKMIEQWGSGIPRVVSLILSHDLQEPEFIDMEVAFRVNIYRDQKGINDTICDTNTQNMIPFIKNNREGSLLETLKKRPDITQKELSQIMGVSTPTIKRMLARMQEKGIVKREGTNRKGKWIVL